MWFEEELEGKPTGMFLSTRSIHGGYETTILTSLAPLVHLGMVFVGVRYSTNDQIMTTGGVGGSPYGPSTMPRKASNVEAPTPEEIETARSLGRRVTQVARPAAGNRTSVRAGRTCRITGTQAVRAADSGPNASPHPTSFLSRTTPQPMTLQTTSQQRETKTQNGVRLRPSEAQGA
ncbi:MAG: hypothetical protein ACLFTE_09625 [Salinivenus sp.]